jgi:hypothetical protein
MSGDFRHYTRERLLGEFFPTPEVRPRSRPGWSSYAPSSAPGGRARCAASPLPLTSATIELIAKGRAS